MFNEDVLDFHHIKEQLQPKGAQALREILLPGDSAVTAAAWAELTHELHAGAPVGSAVENFCREVFANAGLCPG